MDNKGNLYKNSNFGYSIDLAAPGVDILSIFPNNKYAYLDGTSMAVPFITGIAALVKSLYNNINNFDIAKGLNNGVKIQSSLKNKVKTNGIIDSYLVLEKITNKKSNNRRVIKK